MQKKYLLFDLDGTLTDSKLGITRCVQYALKSLGIDEPDLDKLECYIGPPLIDSFQRYHGLSLEQAQICSEVCSSMYALPSLMRRIAKSHNCWK